MRELKICLHSVYLDGLPDMERMRGRVAFIFDGGVRSGWPVPDTLDKWEDSVTGRIFVGVTHWIEFPEPLHGG